MKYLFSWWATLLWVPMAFSQASINGALSVLTCNSGNTSYTFINPPCMSGTGCVYHFEVYWVPPQGFAVMQSSITQSSPTFQVNWNTLFALNDNANSNAATQTYYLRSWITGCSNGGCNLSTAVETQDITVTECNSTPAIVGYMSPLSCENETYLLTNLLPVACGNCTYSFELMWYNSSTSQWVSQGSPYSDIIAQYPINWSQYFVLNDATNNNGNTQQYYIKSWINCDSAHCDYGNQSNPVNSPVITVTRCISLPCTPTSASHTIANGILAVPCGSTSPISICAAEVNGAYSYAWTLPSGWTFASGTATNTRCVSIIPNGSGTGTLSVKALGYGQDSDGIANASSSCPLPVNRNTAAAPAWTQAHSLICNNQAKFYTIVPSSVPNASYEWECTGGLLFLGSNTSSGSGFGYTNVGVYAPASGRGQGTVRVRVSTPCGQSPWATQSVCYGVPPQPAAPVVTLCQSEPSASVSLSGSCTGNAVVWIVQPGSIQEGQGTNGISFALNHSQYTQGYYINIGVKTTNACGASQQKNVAIPCTCCGGGGGIMQRAIQGGILEDTIVLHTGAVEIAPNPTQGILTIRSESTEAPLVSVVLTDLNGKTILLYEAPETLYETTLDTGNLGSGLYVCRVQTATRLVQQKVVKE